MPRSTIYNPILRGPGAKTRLAPKIVGILPADIDEYREPFCYSAAVYARVPWTTRRWISDIKPHYAAFYEWLGVDPDAPAAIERMRRLVRDDLTEQVAYYSAWHRRSIGAGTPLDTLVLSRHGYAGIESRTRPNFTINSRKNGLRVLTPERIAYWVAILQRTQITCADYASVVEAPGWRCGLFLDPPYLLNGSDHSSPLYGTPWTWADYERLFCVLKRCRHRWVMTVERSADMHSLFSQDRRNHFDDDRYNGCISTPGIKYQWIIANYDPRTVARLQPVTRKQAYGLATSVSTIGATE